MQQIFPANFMFGQGGYFSTWNVLLQRQCWCDQSRTTFDSCILHIILQQSHISYCNNKKSFLFNNSQWINLSCIIHFWFSQWIVILTSRSQTWHVSFIFFIYSFFNHVYWLAGAKSDLFTLYTPWDTRTEKQWPTHAVGGRHYTTIKHFVH